jgi:hypothetical protein
MTPPLPSGQHLELPVEEQLARAKPWLPAEQMLLGDLTEEEEAAFLDAISR